MILHDKKHSSTHCMTSNEAMLRLLAEKSGMQSVLLMLSAHASLVNWRPWFAQFKRHACAWYRPSVSRLPLTAALQAHNTDNMIVQEIRLITGALLQSRLVAAMGGRRTLPHAQAAPGPSCGNMATFWAGQ